jgi:hypothetical protein
MFSLFTKTLMFYLQLPSCETIFSRKVSISLLWLPGRQTKRCERDGRQQRQKLGQGCPAKPSRIILLVIPYPQHTA